MYSNSWGNCTGPGQGTQYAYEDAPERNCPLRGSELQRKDKR